VIAHASRVGHASSTTRHPHRARPSSHPGRRPKHAKKPRKAHQNAHHAASGHARHTHTGPRAAAHVRLHRTFAPPAVAPATQSIAVDVQPPDPGLQILESLPGLFAAPSRPPSFLVPIFKAAGRRYDVPWRILAAINEIETDYGRDLSISSAGAMGWMQFMPATWREYAVDANRNGHPNPYDPRDAIFSAARYLHANGASTDLRRAIFAYNHAEWYVDAVMWRARTVIAPTTTRADVRHAAGWGYALPLDARYMSQLGRTDDGLDIEDAPDGAAVYSITDGIVTAVASDPGGFGPNYPVIQVTDGPLAGRFIYYGHVADSLVQPGQHVLAGQPIAVMGHTGDAASLGHGHIEIGFSDAGGDPVSHGSSGEPWTASGEAMRVVLVSLAAAFGVKTA
jgi:murein DD-endopeptidase MepM/ murein hydrolase activator NlpD